MESRNESELLGQLHEGSVAAFTELYREHAPRLYVNILQMVKDRQAAEEIVQEIFLPGRGEGGMVMNTNPANDPEPYGQAKAWQTAYFSECMTGFEHQVASHMMGEGMARESIILTRAIHDRYHASKRNPFNEIECSDHYGRAMASFGTFITACGFEYNGPREAGR